MRGPRGGVPPQSPPPARQQPPAGAPRPTSGKPPRTRKAQLRLAHVDTWSVTKVSFVLSIALAIVTVAAVVVLWVALDVLGVFSSLEHTIGDISGSSNGGISGYLSFGTVIGFTLIVAIIDIVLVTAIATLGGYLYNIACGFVGGLEVTLAEDNT